jgi:hypothetical protein
MPEPTGSSFHICYRVLRSRWCRYSNKPPDSVSSGMLTSQGAGGITPTDTVAFLLPSEGLNCSLLGPYRLLLIPAVVRVRACDASCRECSREVEESTLGQKYKPGRLPGIDGEEAGRASGHGARHSALRAVAGIESMSIVPSRFLNRHCSHLVGLDFHLRVPDPQLRPCSLIVFFF